MVNSCHSVIRIGICLSALALVIGCGDSKQPNSKVKDVSGVVVKGRLVQNGKPLKLLKDEQIHVTFVLKTDEMVASPAEFNPEDASFVVKGPTEKGLPAGSYKIGLSSDNYGGGDDRFAEKLDLVTSPLVAEVGSEEGQYFEVDVGTKRVTKKK